MYLKLKVEAIDPDGTVAQVQFFANTNLLGVVTNPPFNLVWQVDYDFETQPDPGLTQWNLKAVATDDLGATNESATVRIASSLTRPSFPVAEMVSPRDGAVFAEPASFVFRAEVWASTYGFAGPVEFFVGTNSVGKVDEGTRLTATTPPSSVIVSNLLEGEYKLTIRFYEPGTYCIACVLATNTIRVIKLGVQSPRLTPDRLFQFEVLTSFPDVETVIQASPNLLDWTSVSTNRPTTNTFLFTETSPATNRHQFYRVVLPSEPP